MQKSSKANSNFKEVSSACRKDVFFKSFSSPGWILQHKISLLKSVNKKDKVLEKNMGFEMPHSSIIMQY